MPDLCARDENHAMATVFDTITTFENQALPPYGISPAQRPTLCTFHPSQNDLSPKRRQKFTDLSISPTLCPERLFGVRHCPIRRFTSTRVLSMTGAPLSRSVFNLFHVSPFVFRLPPVGKFAKQTGSNNIGTISITQKRPVVSLMACSSTEF